MCIAEDVIKDLETRNFSWVTWVITPLKLEEEGRRLGQRDEMEEEALEIQVQERLPIVGWI